MKDLSRILVVLSAHAWTFLAIPPALAQLGSDCTVSVLNRTVQVEGDGAFFIADVPAEPGFFRVRAHCTPATADLAQGESPIFQFVPNGLVEIESILFGQTSPIPVSLNLLLPTTTFTEPGIGVPLRVDGILGDGSTTDLTARATGTEYWSSDASRAEISADGVLTPLRRGRILIAARNQGVLVSRQIEIQVPNDADQDGMTDEYEEALGLDPTNPNDAFEDPDGDGLGNLAEFELGTDIYVDDTDADGLLDGEEVELGTDPTNGDGDGDRLPDGDEIRLGTNPFFADSDDDRLLDGIEVALGLDPLIANATTAATGQVRLGDGTLVRGGSVVAFGLLVATTDIDGRFSFDAVPADQGALQLFARSIQDGRVFDGFSQPTAPIPGGVTDVGVISLGEMSGRVTGRVLGADGVEVPLASVTLRTGSEQRRANADVTGVYVIDRLPPGAVEVEALDARTGLRGRATGTLAEGADLVLDVELGAFGAIRGPVLGRDAETELGPGITVELRRLGSGDVFESTTSDRLSRYSFDFVPLGRWQILSRDSEGNRGLAEVDLESTSQVVEAPVAFLGMGSVDVTVETSEAERVPNAAVVLKTSGLFNRTLEAVTGSDGTVRIADVFVGRFTVTATHPETGRRASGGGEIFDDGEVIPIRLVVPVPLSPVDLSANLTGTVYRVDGETPVAGAIVSLGQGFGELASGDGVYAFDRLPLGDYTIQVDDPASDDCGRETAGLPTDGQTVTRDISLFGLGNVLVTVLYADGRPAAGSSVVMTTGSSPCDAERSGMVGGDGQISFSRFPVGSLNIDAEAPIGSLRGSIGTSLEVGETAEVTVQLEAYGSVVGTVFEHDGVTPVPSMTVTLGSRTRRTDNAGRFRFDLVKASAGSQSLEARDARGGRLARASGILIALQDDVVERNLVLVNRGTVRGQVVDQLGEPAANLKVRVTTSAGSYPSLYPRTDASGFYQVDGVPAGIIDAFARDDIRRLEGEATGVLVLEGDVEVLDIMLDGDQILSRHYDANNHIYPVQSPSGSLVGGSQDVFRISNDENRGAAQLEIGQGGSFRRFIGPDNRVEDGREIVLEGSDASGLDVVRKVFVHPDGYFARYLEIFENQTPGSITVDVRIDSFYRFVSNLRNGFLFQDPADVVLTSSGNRTLSLSGLDPDRWAVLDVELSERPSLDAVFPETAHVFDGEGGRLSAAIARYDYFFDQFFSRLRYQWQEVEVPAGGRVALLHFVVQQTDVAPATASAKRLVQLPPEALEGLSASELQAIANFAPPPGGVSTLPPLPPLDGDVEGRVLESDGATPVTVADVRWQSSDAIFARRYSGRSNGQGEYRFRSTDVSNGNRIVVPRVAYTVDATNRITRVNSPAYEGDFGASALSTRDIVFVDTSTVTGTVRRSSGNVVSDGDVKLRGRNLLINLERSLPADGTFTFLGLPPELYSLVANEPNPQGTGLAGAGSANISEGGQTVTANITLPATGGADGMVSLGSGSPAPDLQVSLEAPGFTRRTTTDSGGFFRFLDVPVGTYELEVRDPITELPTRATVNITAETVITEDLQLQTVGTVIINAVFTGGPGAGQPVRNARVWLTMSAFGNGFIFQGRTDAFGKIVLPGIPTGTIGARIRHPQNAQIAVDAAGVLASQGDVLTFDLEVPVDNPPAVAVVLPLDGAQFQVGSSVLLTAAASDDFGVEKVEFVIDGETVAVDTAPPFTVTVPLLGDVGDSVQILARATDNLPQTTVSAPITVSLIGDVVKPSITLISPTASDRQIEGTRLRIHAAASDNVAVDRVEIFAGGELVQTATTSPYVFDYEIADDYAGAGPTPLLVLVTAYDRAGNSRSDQATLFIDPDQPPTIELSQAPDDGAQVIEGDVVVFAATASDDLGAEVDLLVQGQAVQSRANAPYRFQYEVPSPFELGSTLEIRLRARDAQGQTALTEVTTIEILSDLPPEAEITAPAEGAEFTEGSTFTFAATASDDLGIERVRLEADGELLADLEDPPYETEVFVDSGEDLTPIELAAVAVDTSGQSVRESVTVVRRDDTVAPAIELLAPADGSILTVGPSDVMLVIDRSGSTNDSSGVDFDGDGDLESVFQAEILAALAVLDQLNPEVNRVGIVFFETDAFLAEELTDDFVRLRLLLESLRNGSGSGGTNFRDAMRTATDELVGERARRSAVPVQVFLSDGIASFPELQVQRAEDGAILVNTFAVGEGADSEVLQRIADRTGAAFTEVLDPATLVDVLPRILLFGLDLLFIEADASDDVRVRDVTFTVQSGDGVIDETIVDEEASYLTGVSLPTLPESLSVDVQATARDYGDNEVATDPVSVTILPAENLPKLRRLDPAIGLPGDVVVLRGSFFEPQAELNTVNFLAAPDPAAPVPVLEGNKVLLQVQVPEGTGSGGIKVSLVDPETLEVLESNELLFQLDPDRDGLGELDEAALGTDNNNPDSDGDGLLDGDEVHVHGTDPLDSDSDDDGLPDGFEVNGGLDPNDGGDVTLDADLDGLTNLAEFLAGTDPQNPDSDGDGLGDGEEVNFIGTDPTDADTDDGGRDDGQELNIDGTDPLDPSDDLTGILLPSSLTDGFGFEWSVQANSTLRQFDAATLLSTGLSLRVADVLVPTFEFADFDENVRELVIGPFSQAGLEIHRKIFVPENAGFVRYLEIFDNPTADEITVEANLRTLLQNTSTRLIATSSGDLSASPDDFYVVMDDAGELGRDPLIFVFGAPYVELPATHVFAADNSRNVNADFDLMVPAGERRILMHLIARRPSRGEAISDAEQLRRLTGAALDQLSAAEIDDIVNFAAYPDTDGDGIGDGDELVLGTDPTLADSDGDGLDDGLELVLGLDPLDPADGAADADGDGLSNVDEVNVHGTDPLVADSDGDGLSDGDEVDVHGTDPLVADSDGDGLTDGDEVDVHGTDPLFVDTDGGGRSDGDEVAAGTDPLDPVDDRLALPIALVDGDGRSWSVQRDGRIFSSAVFDAGYVLSVQGGVGEQIVAFPEFAEGLSTLGGREVVLGPWQPDPSLQVVRRLFVPADDGFVRVLDLLSNVGAEPIDVTVQWQSDLDSELQSQVLVTSSGDATVDRLDRWAITDDALIGEGDPTLSHLLRGRGAEEAAYLATFSRDDLQVAHALHLEPGERKILMAFTAASADVTAALERVDALDQLPPSTLTGLGSAELADIVNFFPFPDADFDGLSDSEEAALGTDANNPDTVGDGLLDGWEARFGFDPLVAGDGAADTDGDGLSNAQEQLEGTDPVDADSDDDGASDGDEVLVLLSDPLLPDSDGDGLLDGREAELGTDPNLTDTDNGGRSDRMEVEIDFTDPLDLLDDLPLLGLPVTLADGPGFNWDVQRDGSVRKGDLAFQDAFRLKVDGEAFPAFSKARSDLDNRQYTLGPWVHGDLEIWRRVHVPSDDGFIRYLEVLINPTGGALEATLELNFEHDRNGTHRVAASREFGGFSPLDTYQVIDDGTESGGSLAIAQVMRGAFGQRPESTVLLGDSPYTSTFSYRVQVPAFSRLVLMHFATQRSERSEALDVAQQLSTLSGGALSAIGAVDLEGVVNFLIPDADRDGLRDDDEALLGTDPAAPDSDGDGLLDGFEVLYAFDPLTGGDAARDDDGDGLDAAAEQALLSSPLSVDSDGDGFDDDVELEFLGSDPAWPDSDGGGVSDVEEWRQGSDLSDYQDEVATGFLPGTQSDGSGYFWDIQRDGRVLRGVNAFDGGYRLVVDGQAMPEIVPGFRSSRELVAGPWQVAGLEVRRRVRVSEALGFARYLEVFYNPTTEPITVDVEWLTDLLSDNRTAVVATSDGDQILSADDGWLITRNTQSNSFPRVVHFFASDGGSVAPDTASRLFGEVEIAQRLTVPAGGRTMLMHFSAQVSGDAAALERVEQLQRFEGETLDGLARHQRLDIVNILAFADSDGDLLADEEEILLGTDPNNPDTDGDGALDGFEVAFGFDPLDPADGVFDPDGDGLDNAGESSIGTDPLDADSDDDGLGDGDEVNLYGSDPLAVDSDGDGLSDGDEVNVHGTDPTLFDSDGGGRSDADEIFIDVTDPLDASDDAVAIRLNNNLNYRADGLDIAADEQGNLHVVWNELRFGTSCLPLVYTMLDGAGRTLIDDTQISDCGFAKEAELSIDRAGQVHVVWTEDVGDFFFTQELVFYTVLDPSLDDQDGSSADPGAIAPVPPTLLSGGDEAYAIDPQIAADSQDRVHVVWTQRTPSDEIHYLQLDTAGNVVVPERFVVRGRYPSLAADAAGGVHLAYQDLFFRDSIWYFLLDGATGDALIDATDLTPASTESILQPEITPLGDGTVLFHYASRIGTSFSEIFRLRIDPSGDDRDGSASDAASLVIEGPSLVTTQDDLAATSPAVGQLASGELFLAYRDRRLPVGVDILGQIVDASGVGGPPRILNDPQAPVEGNGLIDATAFGGTGYVVWRQDTELQEAAYLGFYDPDSDADGLSNVDEHDLGSDPGNPDTDGDGLPDGYEVRFLLDPLDPADALSDADGDGLNNLGEFAAGTDPRDVDSDGDGLSDGDEVLVHGTDPRDVDSDDDGLSDFDEVQVHGTNPTDVDTDDDDLSDAYEVTNGFDPLDPADGLADGDGDGLSFGLEISSGTDPTNPDSDGDTLLDGAEVLTYGSDPLSPESDGDGLGDGVEVNTYGTDPALFDTDGGGRGDGDEIQLDNTDPFDPADDLLPVRINESPVARRPRVAVDEMGRVHTAWIDGRDPFCEAIFYSLLDQAGHTLIDDSAISAGECTGAQLTLAVDDLGLAHVAWSQEEGDLYYAKVDPSLDDLDGSAASPAALVVPAMRLVDAPVDPGQAAINPSLRADEQGGVYIAWTQTPTRQNGFFTSLFSQILVRHLDAAGTTVGDTVLYTNSYGSFGGGGGFLRAGQVPGDGKEPGDGTGKFDGGLTFGLGQSGLGQLWPRLELNQDGLHVVFSALEGEIGGDLIEFEDLGGGGGGGGGGGFPFPVVAGDNEPHQGEQKSSTCPSELDDSECEPWHVYYAVLDAQTLGFRMAPSNLTPAAPTRVSFPSLNLKPTGEAIVGYQQRLDFGAFEGFRLLADSNRDDLDGDAADRAQIVSSEATALTPADGVDSLHTQIFADEAGQLFVFYAEERGSGTFDFLLRILDGSGAEVLAPRSITGAVEAGSGDLDRLPGAALRSPTFYTAWQDEDATISQDVILLQVTAPDSDLDGLSDVAEAAAGTDRSDPDSDSDGLLDGFEARFGLDPLDPADGPQDADGDGLSNFEEQQLAIDPSQADTDGDGLSDGDEVNVYGTEVLRVDTDRDGVSDGDEVHIYGSNPLAVDSDGDTLDDLYEVQEGMDPADGTDAAQDLDGDGLTSLEEFNLGTRPLVADTDGDGLLDGDEVNVHGTDPLSPDTDGDTLTDGSELQRFATNPLAADSDGDAFDDFREVAIDGTDPLSSASSFAAVELDSTASPTENPSIARDAAGNLHVAWQDNRLGSVTQIFYSMQDASGQVLIADTQLTQSSVDAWRPRLAVDAAGHVHLAYEDRDPGVLEIYHLEIDPSLDDQDGSPAVFINIVSQPRVALSLLDGVESREARLVVDAADQVHVVWGEVIGRRVFLARRGSDGTVTLPATLLHTGSQFSRPSLAVDGDGHSHVAWHDAAVPGGWQLLYTMVDGAGSSRLIDTTELTEPGRFDNSPEIALTGSGQLAVAFEEAGEDTIQLMRIDPSADDQDGSAADLNTIVTLERTQIPAVDSVTTLAMAIDASDTLHLAYVADERRIYWQQVTTGGAVVAPETQVDAASTDDAQISLIAVGPTSLVSYEQRITFASRRVVLATMNPDTDGDGLSNLEEYLLGTDNQLVDTDGGGTSDGDEVLAGTDPLDPSDDV